MCIYKFVLINYAKLTLKIEEFERAELERMEERKSATRKIMEKMKQDETLRSMEGKTINNQ